MNTLELVKECSERGERSVNASRLFADGTDLLHITVRNGLVNAIRTLKECRSEQVACGENTDHVDNYIRNAQQALDLIG